MKKRLTEDQFQVCIRDLKLGSQTTQIAHGVLVLGQRQAVFVAALGLTRGAVSQAVNRVWEAYLPPGYERVSVVLPEQQAYIVKKWAREAQKMEPKK